MTAILPGSYRVGNLAEGIGCEMLRRFAAVAPVPRPEDIGIDAMCTLLRPDGNRWYAENTFAVQIKSENDDPYTLKPHGYDWLNRLDIPFFLMTVNLNDARARLYSTEWALAYGRMPGWTESYPEKPRRFEHPFPEHHPWFLAEQGAEPIASGTEEDPQRIWLGPMIAEFQLAELNEANTVIRIQRLLKAWCDALANVIYFRRHGIRYTLKWETGAVPTYGWHEIVAQGDNPAAVRATLERLSPVLDVLALQLDPNADAAVSDAIATLRRMADEAGIARLPGVHTRTVIMPRTT